MRFISSALSILALLCVGGCAGFGTRSSPPTVIVSGVHYTEERLRASDPTHHFLPHQESAGTPTTILTIRSGDLDGTIRIRKIGGDIQGEDIPWAANASAYLVAKKERKHYRWGEAQSCLAQFTNEAYGASPNNSDLIYQVAGTSADGRFSVFSSFRIGHPKLPSRRGARTYKSDEISQVDHHPDVRLIERARGSDFRPSIVHIDGIVDRLRMQE